MPAGKVSKKYEKKILHHLRKESDPDPLVPGSGSGSAPKCHGSPILEKRFEGFLWRRRYILVQLLIMFQYLQTSVKFKTDKQVSQVPILKIVNLNYLLEYVRCASTVLYAQLYLKRIRVRIPYTVELLDSDLHISSIFDCFRTFHIS